MTDPDEDQEIDIEAAASFRRFMMDQVRYKARQGDPLCSQLLDLETGNDMYLPVFDYDSDTNDIDDLEIF